MMTAIPATKSCIRKVNVRHDLLAVADLIEICFSSTLDDDGRMYLNHLRWAARDFNYLSWLQGAAERIASPLYGFVWEENGRIVGNLSLIPFYRQGKVYYLIANVAVHPDFRQRGIGRQLTQTAVEHLRERKVDMAWLQVREDNPVAHHLYQSLGFTDRAYRTHWLANASPPPSNLMPPPGVRVQSRRAAEWSQHLKWLQQAYPPEVAWNLSINFSRLSPSPLQSLWRFFNNEMMTHWTAHIAGQPAGYLSWEPARTASDALWLAAGKPEAEDAVQALLLHARERLSVRRRSLSANYPAGWVVDAFGRAGFVNQYTLVWMSIAIP
jgi:ribosomal protein S18 acetylase RimI-like enzyme